MAVAIQPTLVAIDPQGTCRYFDLQGRMLPRKPLNALYIEAGPQGKNAKKVINH